MGRNKMTRFDKRIRVDVRLHPDLVEKLDKICKFARQSKSEIIEGYLKEKLLGAREHCRHEMRQSLQNYNYWEYQLKRIETEDQLKFVSD